MIVFIKKKNIQGILNKIYQIRYLVCSSVKGSNILKYVWSSIDSNTTFTCFDFFSVINLLSTNISTSLVLEKELSSQNPVIYNTLLLVENNTPILKTCFNLLNISYRHTQKWNVLDIQKHDYDILLIMTSLHIYRITEKVQQVSI